MKRILAIVFLGISLAGCASTGGIEGFTRLITTGIANPVTPAALSDVKNAYGIALAAAVAYRERPRCTKTHLESVTNLCARRSIVVKLQQADLKAQAALAKADMFVADNPTLNAGSVIQAASLAVSAFQGVLR
jgi:hypothetical protein